MPTYQLTSEVYLDKMSKCYRKIITINKQPTDSSLNTIIRTVRREKLSIFHGNGNACDCTQSCLFVVLNPNNLNEFLCLDNIAELFTFLIDNGYTIQTAITEILMPKNKNIICFFSK